MFEKPILNILLFSLLLLALSQKALALTESTLIIEADKVQSMGFQGEGQTVCVIDSGINYTHPALGGCTSAQFLGGTCSKVIAGYDFYNNDKDPMDDAGHGTHIAGIVASEDSIYKGVAPKAKLVALKVCNALGENCTKDLEEAAFNWCIGNASKYNISVITMSLGGTTKNKDFCNSDQLANEINTAVGQGIAVIISSGNEEFVDGIGASACVQNATSVGATYDYS